MTPDAPNTSEHGNSGLSDVPCNRTAHGSTEPHPEPFSCTAAGSTITADSACAASCASGYVTHHGVDHAAEYAAATTASVPLDDTDHAGVTTKTAQEMENIIGPVPMPQSVNANSLLAAATAAPIEPCTGTNLGISTGTGDMSLSEKLAAFKGSACEMLWDSTATQSAVTRVALALGSGSRSRSNHNSEIVDLLACKSLKDKDRLLYSSLASTADGLTSLDSENNSVLSNFNSLDSTSFRYPGSYTGSTAASTALCASGTATSYTSDTATCTEDAGPCTTGAGIGRSSTAAANSYAPASPTTAGADTSPVVVNINSDASADSTGKESAEVVTGAARSEDERAAPNSNAPTTGFINELSKFLQKQKIGGGGVYQLPQQRLVLYHTTGNNAPAVQAMPVQSVQAYSVENAFGGSVQQYSPGIRTFSTPNHAMDSVTNRSGKEDPIDFFEKHDAAAFEVQQRNASRSADVDSSQPLSYCGPSRDVGTAANSGQPHVETYYQPKDVGDTDCLHRHSNSTNDSTTAANNNSSNDEVRGVYHHSLYHNSAGSFLYSALPLPASAAQQCTPSPVYIPTTAHNETHGGNGQHTTSATTTASPAQTTSTAGGPAQTTATLTASAQRMRTPSELLLYCDMGSDSAQTPHILSPVSAAYPPATPIVAAVGMVSASSGIPIAASSFEVHSPHLQDSIPVDLLSPPLTITPCLTSSNAVDCLLFSPPSALIHHHPASALSPSIAPLISSAMYAPATAGGSVYPTAALSPGAAAAFTLSPITYSYHPTDCSGIATVHPTILPASATVLPASASVVQSPSAMFHHQYYHNIQTHQYTTSAAHESNGGAQHATVNDAAFDNVLHSGVLDAAYLRVNTQLVHQQNNVHASRGTVPEQQLLQQPYHFLHPVVGGASAAGGWSPTVDGYITVHPLSPRSPHDVPVTITPTALASSSGVGNEYNSAGGFEEYSVGGTHVTVCGEHDDTVGHNKSDDNQRHDNNATADDTAQDIPTVQVVSAARVQEVSPTHAAKLDDDVHVAGTGGDGSPCVDTTHCDKDQKEQESQKKQKELLEQSIALKKKLGVYPMDDDPYAMAQLKLVMPNWNNKTAEQEQRLSMAHTTGTNNGTSVRGTGSAAAPIGDYDSESNFIGALSDFVGLHTPTNTREQSQGPMTSDILSAYCSSTGTSRSASLRTIPAVASAVRGVPLATTGLSIATSVNIATGGVYSAVPDLGSAVGGTDADDFTALLAEKYHTTNSLQGLLQNFTHRCDDGRHRSDSPIKCQTPSFAKGTTPPGVSQLSLSTDHQYRVASLCGGGAVPTSLSDTDLFSSNASAYTAGARAGTDFHHHRSGSTWDYENRGTAMTGAGSQSVSDQLGTGTEYDHQLQQIDHDSCHTHKRPPQLPMGADEQNQDHHASRNVLDTAVRNASNNNASLSRSHQAMRPTPPMNYDADDGAYNTGTIRTGMSAGSTGAFGGESEYSGNRLSAATTAYIQSLRSDLGLDPVCSRADAQKHTDIAPPHHTTKMASAAPSSPASAIVNTFAPKYTSQAHTTGDTAGHSSAAAPRSNAEMAPRSSGLSAPTPLPLGARAVAAQIASGAFGGPTSAVDCSGGGGAHTIDRIAAAGGGVGGKFDLHSTSANSAALKFLSTCNSMTFDGSHIGAFGHQVHSVHSLSDLRRENAPLLVAMLAHPDEFKNPSSFLKAYGDPACGKDNRPMPRRGRDGNWACPRCNNINYPRRFRCNKEGCATERDKEGDKIVSEYARLVFVSYCMKPRGPAVHTPTSGGPNNSAQYANNNHSIDNSAHTAGNNMHSIGMHGSPMPSVPLSPGATTNPQLAAPNDTNRTGGGKVSRSATNAACSKGTDAEAMSDRTCVAGTSAPHGNNQTSSDRRQNKSTGMGGNQRAGCLHYNGTGSQATAQTPAMLNVSMFEPRAEYLSAVCNGHVQGEAGGALSTTVATCGRGMGSSTRHRMHSNGGGMNCSANLLHRSQDSAAQTRHHQQLQQQHYNEQQQQQHAALYNTGMHMMQSGSGSAMDGSTNAVSTAACARGGGHVAPKQPQQQHYQRSVHQPPPPPDSSYGVPPQPNPLQESNNSGYAWGSHQRRRW